MEDPKRFRVEPNLKDNDNFPQRIASVRRYKENGCLLLGISRRAFRVADDSGISVTRSTNVPVSRRWRIDLYSPFERAYCESSSVLPCGFAKDRGTCAGRYKPAILALQCTTGRPHISSKNFSQNLLRRHIKSHSLDSRKPTSASARANTGSRYRSQRADGRASPKSLLAASLCSSLRWMTLMIGGATGANGAPSFPVISCRPSGIPRVTRRN